MKNINVTLLEKQVLEALAKEMYAEPGYSDAGLKEVCKNTGLSPKIIRGVQSSLLKKGFIDIDERKDDLDVNWRDPNTHIWYLSGDMASLVEHWREELELDEIKLITE